MRIDRRWAGPAPTQGGVFIEGSVESPKDRAEYPPNLQLAPLELALVVFEGWHFHPQLESSLDFAYHPEVACLVEKQIGQRLVNTPFQVLKCHPHGFVEAIRTFPLDHGLQHITHVETVFG